MFGYLGNEYSGKQKFNVGRNISNTRGSSSGINCFAPYAPQSLTHNCLQSWSEGNGNQQSGNLKFNLGKNSSNAPSGAPEFCSLFCHRVQLLALCRVNSNSQSWSINCTIETVGKTNNCSTIQFEFCAQKWLLHWMNVAIFFVHLSYFPYFCIHFLVQIWVSCLKEILLAVTWACWKCVSSEVCIIMALSQQIGIQLECQSCDQWGRSRGARGEN